MECHRIFVKFGEGVFGDLWGHERMSVKVAADPVGEVDFGIGVLFTKVFDIPSGVFPG